MYFSSASTQRVSLHKTSRTMKVPEHSKTATCVPVGTQQVSAGEDSMSNNYCGSLTCESVSGLGTDNGY